MLHTRVRCRARVWDVLDVRRTADVTTWYLLRSQGTPRLIASPPDHVEEVSPAVRQVSRRSWVRRALARLQDAPPPWWPARAEQLPIALVPWQFVPAMLVLSAHHRRLLLADQVGMGKTVQAAVLLHELHAGDPTAATLVVCPPALLVQWQQELLVRSGVQVCMLDASALSAESGRPRRDVDASREGSCWLISVDLLRQPDVVGLLARTPWTLMVVDEAHVCAPATSRLQAVERVAQASARVLLLTATPTASGPAGADALRRIGQRRGERAMAVIRRPASWLARPPRSTRTLRVRLDDEEMALCSRLDGFVERARRERGAPGLLPALVLRRRACSCPAALVRSLERRIAVLGAEAPEPVQRTPGLFDDPLDADGDDDELMRVPAWLDERAERGELESMLKYARAVRPAGRKLRMVGRLIRRTREPMLVFTSYVDTARVLRDELGGLRVALVHGGQPDALRAQAVEAFTCGDIDVLITTDASAEGLNLQARCRLVLHIEVPSSARALEQRAGRVDRYGQQRRVHALVLASDTTEDRAALARLHQRSDEDEMWLARVRQDRCRRCRLAAGIGLVRWRGGAGPPQRPPADVRGGGVVTVCRMATARWRRTAVRWRLPPGTTALWLGTLLVGSSASPPAAVPVALALRGRTALPSTVAAWRVLLPGVSRRALRLSRTMHAWRSAAEHASSRERHRLGSDLFGATDAPASAATPPFEAWALVRADAVIGCTEAEAHRHAHASLRVDGAS